MKAAKKAGQVMAPILVIACLSVLHTDSALAGGEETGDARAGGVIVHRGAEVGLEARGAGKLTRAERGVTVHRGVVPERKVMSSSRSKALRYSVQAGEELWLVDPRTGRLVVCQLRGSGYAGQSSVYCTRARLPGSRL